MSNILKQNNLKKTKTRQEILKAINQSKLPICAEEIYQKCLDKDVNINLSTVYRTLNTLEEKEILIKQIRNDGKSYFQENNHEHKHLFICTQCSEKIVLDNCPLECLLNDLSKANDFTVTSHNIELYGLCKKCSSKQK